MTASFLAVALTAAVRPFRYNIFLKKSDRWVSFKLPMALAAFLNAIFKRLLPLGTLLLIILPPVFLLLGASRSQLVRCLDVSNFWKPWGPISHIMLRWWRDLRLQFLRQVYTAKILIGSLVKVNAFDGILILPLVCFYCGWKFFLKGRYWFVLWETCWYAHRTRLFFSGSLEYSCRW